MSAPRVVVLLTALATCFAGAVSAQQPKTDDPLIIAMSRELERSKNLRLVDLNDAYFIEYRLEDGENLTIGTTLGAVVTQSRSRMRVPRVQVRVGSYEFDNTNYVLSGHDNRIPQAPLDNNIGALQSYFWLATDRAYKRALLEIARKRAALKNVNLPEQLPDFAKAEPVVKILPLRREEIDVDEWTGRMRRLSSIFVRYPRITRSSTRFSSLQSNSYLINTEGSVVRYPELIHFVVIRASGQAPDGMRLRDATVVQRLSIKQMPPELEIERAARLVAENVTALTEAPVSEAYVGPVVFEGIAAGQLFAQLLGGNLALSRRPVPEPGRSAPFRPSRLEGRLGARVLPRWMTVVDDPTQTEWMGRPLLGHYVVDSEGVVPEPLTLVENGILKGFLLSRQPVKGFAKSNGRARLPGQYGAGAAVLSNLFVKAEETVTESGLKQKLIEMCRRQGKPYGILIRKLDFPSSASFSELRRLFAGARESGGAAGLVSQPILAYRVYPDGREELVRGLRFRGLDVRSLRDIIAASDESHQFDYMPSTAPLSLIGAGGFVTTSSVVAPSVLVEDLELDRDVESLPKLPVVPPPPLIAQQ